MQTTNPNHNQPQPLGASSASSASSPSAVSADKLPGIRHIIAVGSGKGGVGKSTVSVNLALALQQLGARVGLVDADILGPSIPGMLGIPTGEPPAMTPDSKMIQAERHGLKAVSMGMLTGDGKPAVLRGPMVGKYLKMVVDSVQWGPLDYLILDLPPGTGDTQLTLAQSMPLSGVVIVTTPQAVSLKIARRGLRMFEKVAGQDSWDRREHAHLHLPPSRREHGYLPSRWWRADEPRARRPIPGCLTSRCRCRDGIYLFNDLRALGVRAAAKSVDNV